MRFVRLVTGGALGALVAAVGCSESAPETAPETRGVVTQAVQNGVVDTTNKYPWAVGVCFGFPRSGGLGPSNQGCFGTCSGTLVLPNMVITARHCVSDSPEKILCENAPSFGAAKGNASRFFITTGFQMTPGTAGWHNVKQVLVPSDDKICGNDIAILILNDSVPGAEAKPAIPGVQYPMGDGRYAIDYAAIGYGITSPNGQDSGTRRIKTNVRLTCVPNDEFLACPAEAGVNPREFVGGDGICSGDSGSGAFESKSFGTAGAAPVSWGVLSRGGQNDAGTTCIGSIYTRLDQWRDFVVQAAEQASNNWQLYPKPTPDWTVYVPPAQKDAGVKDAAPPPTTAPAGAGLGETCDVDADCASKACAASPEGSRVCTKACDDAAGDTCPEGFLCTEASCFPEALATKAAPPKTTTTTSSCAAAPGTRDASPALLAGAVLGLAVAAGRRRRP